MCVCVCVFSYKTYDKEYPLHIPLKLMFIKFYTTEKRQERR